MTPDLQLISHLTAVGIGVVVLTQDTTFMSKIAWPIVRPLLPGSATCSSYRDWMDVEALDERFHRHFLPDLLACPFCLAFWTAVLAQLTIPDVGVVGGLLNALAAAGLTATVRQFISLAK